MDSKTGVCPAYRDNKDLYGLGIRLGFYIQWVGLILCELFDKKKPCNQSRHLHSEFFGIRVANASFVTAAFIAILVRIAKTSLKSDREIEFIQPVDIYIVLLLCFGSSLFLVVVFIWNMFTPLDVDYPMRPSRLSVRLSCLLLAAVSLFQLWFWSQNLDFKTCKTYGFAFNKTTIDDIAFRATHGILYGALLLVVVLNFISSFFLPKRFDKLGQKLWSSKMRAWYCLAKLLVCAVIIVATELTITWNDMKTLYELDSAGQTIPFVVGCWVFARVIYVTGIQDRVWEWEEAVTWKDMFGALKRRFRREDEILERARPAVVVH